MQKLTVRRLAVTCPIVVAITTFAINTLVAITTKRCFPTIIPFDVTFFPRTVIGHSAAVPVLAALVKYTLVTVVAAATQVGIGRLQRATREKGSVRARINGGESHLPNTYHERRSTAEGVRVDATRDQTDEGEGKRRRFHREASIE